MREDFALESISMSTYFKFMANYILLNYVFSCYLDHFQLLLLLATLIQRSKERRGGGDGGGGLLGNGILMSSDGHRVIYITIL